MSVWLRGLNYINHLNHSLVVMVFLWAPGHWNDSKQQNVWKNPKSAVHHHSLVSDSVYLFDGLKCFLSIYSNSWKHRGCSVGKKIILKSLCISFAFIKPSFKFSGCLTCPFNHQQSAGVLFLMPRSLWKLTSCSHFVIGVNARSLIQKITFAELFSNVNISVTGGRMWILFMLLNLGILIVVIN